MCSVRPWHSCVSEGNSRSALVLLTRSNQGTPATFAPLPAPRVPGCLPASQTVTLRNAAASISKGSASMIVLTPNKPGGRWRTKPLNKLPHFRSPSGIAGVLEILLQLLNREILTLWEYAPMNFLTQLLPGLRDVRAPLVAGYLWLFTGWLLLAGHLPAKTDADVYANAFAVGDAVGQIGWVTVASVAAYLLGSLLQSIPSWISYNSVLLVRLLRHGSRHPVLRELPRVNAIELLNAPFFAPTDFRSLDGDRRTRRVLEELALSRLGGARRKLDAAVKDATKKVRLGVEGAGPCSEQDLASATAAIEAVGNLDHGWVAKYWGAAVLDHARVEPTDLPLPGLSAARDVIGERVAIQTRLMETAQHAGSEVERLYAESEFRFTVALPLAALATTLAALSGDVWWLLLLIAVVGLLFHAVVLRKHGGRELVEALRSRPTDDDLDRITPVFKRYEKAVDLVIKTFDDINWENLGNLARSKPNRPSKDQAQDTPSS